MGMFKRGKLTDREVKICGLKGKENLTREDIKTEEWAERAVCTN